MKEERESLLEKGKKSVSERDKDGFGTSMPEKETKGNKAAAHKKARA